MQPRVGLVALLAAAMLWGLPPAMAQTTDPMTRLKQALTLTDAEVAKIKPIVDQEIAGDHAHETAMVNRVRPILTPDQVKLLDALRAKQLQPGGTFKYIDFRGDLKMTADQAAKVKVWRAQDRPVITSEHNKYASQIEAQLTPDQKTKYESLRHRRRRSNGASPAPAPSGSAAPSEDDQ